MQQTITKNKPSGLFSRIHSATDDRLPLQEAAQLAIQVEFTTIPAYLTALYSINQLDTPAYQLLRSVVMEEMFHVNQAANILVAIGGLPRFTNQPGQPNVVPEYPNYLPHANPKTTPYVGLYRASPEVFENVFAAIETPAPPHAPPEGDNYNTIAQLYDALRDGMLAYNGKTPLFTPDPKGRQRTDIYLGKFGGKPTDVTDIDKAQKAITQIVQQGEGSVPEGQSLIPIEPWSTYNSYGKRSDGTYGPILGTPYEMSHFTKFRSVALDAANFPSTYPIISNARREDFTNSLAIETSEQFNIAYSIMLDALELSFRKPLDDKAPDPFFALSLPLMHETMPNLARSLMITPARSDGDKEVGPNAAPTFIYKPNTKLDDLFEGINNVMGIVRDTIQDGAAREAKLKLQARALESVTKLKAVHKNSAH